MENTSHNVEVPYEAGSGIRVGQDTYGLLQFRFMRPVSTKSTVSSPTLNFTSFTETASLIMLSSASCYVLGPL